MEELVTLPHGSYHQEEYDDIINVKHELGILTDEDKEELDTALNAVFALEEGDEEKVNDIVENLQTLLAGKEITFSRADLTLYSVSTSLLNETTKNAIKNSLRFLKEADQLAISGDVDKVFSTEQTMMLYVYKPLENQTFPFGALDGYMGILKSFNLMFISTNNPLSPNDFEEERIMFSCFEQDLGSEEELEHFNVIYDLSDKEQYA